MAIPSTSIAEKISSELKPACNCFATVCGAVEYAHKNLVVHRDIKPGKHSGHRRGRAQAAGFRHRQVLAPDGTELAQTRTTERMMTPEYASPEQVRGDPITTSTDVYALGVLLYELLSGRTPVSSRHHEPIEMARVICEQTPTAPSRGQQDEPELAPPDAARELSGDLDNIVLMAMRKEPARRYVSVGQLAEDVNAFLGGYPVRARTDAWFYRSGKFVQRHKAAFSAAVVVAVALIAFSIGMGLLARPGRRERLGAEREAQFLNSIFQSTTPEQSHGKQVTGRELLDQGARRVDTEFSGEPQLQATLFEISAALMKALVCIRMPSLCCSAPTICAVSCSEIPISIQIHTRGVWRLRSDWNSTTKEPIRSSVKRSRCDRRSSLRPILLLP